eukprot:CAMPEP_0198206666 /NCGR_PEP_ID=MMETSP1445-20131203/10210_1 /TAXON_ID=36898 /ORGANISM="Pyramimonas sp., Strain CCMP2087" /LENGTH=118 /DNA_ID=CAMNT_0043879443 /DNA_START=97 /DNA_END=453 /DNA_ORIENTATION=-
MLLRLSARVCNGQGVTTRAWQVLGGGGAYSSQDFPCPTPGLARAYSSHTHTPACGTGECSASTPSSQSSQSEDIAFKPAKGGWGYSKKYATSWDRIFGKKNKTAEEATGSLAEAKETK